MALHRRPYLLTAARCSHLLWLALLPTGLGLAAIPGPAVADSPPAAGGAQAAGTPTAASSPRPAVTVWLVPHAHYDVAWLDPEWETASRIAGVYRDHVLAALSDPQYRFVLDQAPALRAFQLCHPLFWGDLQELIRSGRAQLVGGLYVQPDENLPEGETLLRAAVLGQRYLQATFGLTSRSGFNIDSFGHSWQMPQILRLAGMEEFAFARLGDARRPPKTEFWWVAPDGSRVLTAWMAQGYDVAQRLARSGDLAAEEARLLELIRQLQPMAATDHLLLPVGGDYTPPPPALSNLVTRWNERHPDTRLQVGTLADFFAALRRSGADLPEVSGEFNRVFPGAYSARIWLKQRHRAAEHRLLQAEALATVASLWADQPYPRQELEAAWEALVTNTFHDLLPATAVDGAYQGAERRYALAEATAAETAAAATSALARAAGWQPYASPTPSEGQPAPAAARPARPPAAVALFNTLSWPRREVVRLRLPAAISLATTFRLLDAGSREVTYQILTPAGHHDDAFAAPSLEAAWIPASTATELGHAAPPTGVEIAFVADLPPMGFQVYRLEWGVAPAQSPLEAAAELAIPADGAATVATGAYVARFDAGGNLLQLESPQLGKTWVTAAPGGTPLAGVRGNLVEVRRDTSNAYFPDENGPVLTSTAHLPAQGRLYRGPVLSRVVFQTRLPDGHLVRETLLPQQPVEEAAPGLIRFVTSLDWQGQRASLRVAMPTTGRGETSYDIPYGFTNQRSPGRWPAVKWVDTSSAATGGVALLNRGLPDHEIYGSYYWLTLLRSIDYTFFRPGDSPQALGRGGHRFEYALLPHQGGWREAGVAQAAWAYHQPPVALWLAGPAQSTSGTMAGPGLPDQATTRAAVSTVSFLASSPNVAVTALRRTEGGIMVHTLELYGQPSQAWWRWQQPVPGHGAAQAVDALEQPLSAPPPYRPEPLGATWTPRPQGIHLWRWAPIPPERKEPDAHAGSNQP